MIEHISFVKKVEKMRIFIMHKFAFIMDILESRNCFIIIRWNQT